MSEDRTLDKLKSHLNGKAILKSSDLNLLVSSINKSEEIPILCYLACSKSTCPNALQSFWSILIDHPLSETFIGQWIKNWKRLASSSNYQLLRSIRLSYSIMCHEGALGNSAENIKKQILKFLVTWIDTIEHSLTRTKKKFTKLCIRKIHKTLRISRIFNYCSQYITQDQANLRKYSLFANILTAFGVYSSSPHQLKLHDKFSGSYQYQNFRDKLINFYVEYTFRAKNNIKSSRTVLETFYVLLRTVDCSEFEKVIFPSIEDAVRRDVNSLCIINQSLQIIVATSCSQLTTSTLSNYVLLVSKIFGLQSSRPNFDIFKDNCRILNTLLEYSICKQDTDRQNAFKTIELLLNLTKISDCLVQFMNQELISFCSRPYSNWYERHGVFSTLAVIPDARIFSEPRLKNETMISKIIDTLICLLEKEKNKESIFAGVSALVCWIRLECSNKICHTFDERTRKLLVRLLTSTDVEIVRFCLYKLWDLFYRLLDENFSELSIDMGNAITNLLIEIIGTGKIKPLFIKDALLALSVLQLAASRHAPTREAFQSSYSSMLLSPSSILFTPVFLRRFEELKNEIKQPMYSVVASIIEMAIKYLLTSEEVTFDYSVTSSSIWWLTIQISTSDLSSYRRAMLHVLKRLTDCQAISSIISAQLLKYLIEYLKQSSTVSESPPSRPELLNLFLKTIVTPRVNIEADYPKILMLAHHPFVVHSPINSSIRGLQKKMNLEDNDLISIKDCVVDYLFGKDGLESSFFHIQLASRYATSFLLNYKPYLDVIFRKLCCYLSLPLVKKWLSFPITYIGIFHTPEGHLYRPPDFKEQIPEFYTLKHSNPKNVSTKKGDGSINKQQNSIQTRMKILEEEQLASESSIRKEVASVYHSIASGLDIAELAFRNHYSTFINEDTAMTNFLFPILDPVILLARHQNELQEKACSILSWSCKACLQPPLAQYRNTLVYSIIHPGNQDTQSTCIESLKTFGLSLNLAAWAFFQPVVINCLVPFKPISNSDSGNPTYFRGSIPLQQLSMECLKENSRHVNSMMVDCLLQIIYSVPSLQDKSRTILTEAVQSLSPIFFSHSLTLSSVLLDYIFHPNNQARLAVLDSMLLISHLTEFGQKDQIATALWISRFDSCIDNSELSVSLYKAYSSVATIPENYFDRIWSVIMSNHQEVYEMAAKSMVGAMNLYPASIEETIQKLLQLHKDHYYYEDDSKSRARGSLSRVGTKEKEDWTMVRFRTSLVFKNFGELSTLSPELCILLLKYFETALLENDASTFDQFLKAGIEIIRRQSNQEIAYTLIELFESKLTGSAPSAFIEHRLWEVNVIFLGIAVQHLQHEDARIQKVVSHLFKVLETPSEPVQRVVSDCLSQIVSRDHSRFMPLVEDCLQLILKSNTLYGHRRGGAWGLAGLVHGYKPICLKEYPSIMSRLEKACRSRSDTGSHQGALIAFECLSLKLKTGFEPWIIHLWNYFLNALSDPSQDVRNTAFEASYSVLLQLSPTGLQLVLPALLKLLDANQHDRYFAKWNAIQLISALTQHIFRKLILFLPTIITRLSSLLIDPDYDIQTAAKKTMSSLCNMIQNSQIRAIATKLIMAIDDPDNHLVGAINALAENNYTEMVDAASLALIVLVVDRSIKNGKGDTKKMAIKMVDSICHLTDPKDFYLYYPKLCAQLIDTLNDTIPLNRMIAAHTIGELSLKMNTCHSLSQQLIEMMNQSNTAISIGLSQGLAHVMSHLDQEYVEMEILPRVEVACRSEIVNIRGSFMSLFQFLPTAFGAKFEKFLPFALPVVIQGLSDHQLSVRDAALKSGQAIMSRFNDNIDLILPHLEKAMLDPNWQTRANSLQLLEGLFHEFLTATSKNGDIKDYSKLLSSPVRCRILACLYVLRFDPLSTVSKNAVSAWKTAVLNTGKTLRALVPTFISIIVNRTSYNEIWDLVLHTVGELVQKMGDHVLVGIISEFEKKMNSRLPEGTQDSVCIDVSEILQAAATKAAIHESKKLLFQIVLKGLCNSEPQVRKSAVKILDCLRKYLGESAIDEIFPKLIAQVDNPDTQVRQVALQGIQQILSFHSQHVLPALISKLLQQPISDFNARALASTAKAAGAHLTPFLHTILPTLIQASVSSDMNSNPVNCHLVKEALHSVLLVINTSETLGILFTELAKFVSDKSPELRHASLELICFYATNNQAGQAWLENISFAIHTTLKSYQDADPRIVLSAIDSLATVLSTINVEAIAAESVNVVKVINDTIEHLRFSETTEYLVYTKGFEPILKIYVAAMRNGSSLMREQASLGIRFLFSKSKGASLTPPMIQTVTGTLIRILSERQLESHIRSDILQTLNLVVDYGGSSLKHFSTTLQITYLKFISMPYKPIREQSAIGILKLVSLNPNIPFLVKALITVTKDPMNSNPDACLETVSNIFQSIGKNVDGSLCESMREALNPFLDHEDFTTRQRAAEAFASTLLCLPLTEIMKKVEQLLLDQTQNDKRIETGLLTLYHIMKRNPEFTSTIICDSQSIVDYIILNLSSPIELIRGITSQILALILAYVKNRRQSAYYAKILVKVLDDESIDVKIMALNAIRSYAKAAPEESAYLLKILVPPTLSNVKKNTLPLKCAAERALYCLFQVNKGDALYRQFIENLNEAQRKQFTLFYRTLEKLTDADETAGCVESQMFL